MGTPQSKKLSHERLHSPVFFRALLAVPSEGGKTLRRSPPTSPTLLFVRPFPQKTLSCCCCCCCCCCCHSVATQMSRPLQPWPQRGSVQVMEKSQAMLCHQAEHSSGVSKVKFTSRPWRPWARAPKLHLSPEQLPHHAHGNRVSRSASPHENLLGIR